MGTLKQYADQLRGISRRAEILRSQIAQMGTGGQSLGSHADDIEEGINDVLFGIERSIKSGQELVENFEKRAREEISNLKTINVLEEENLKEVLRLKKFFG